MKTSVIRRSKAAGTVGVYDARPNAPRKDRPKRFPIPIRRIGSALSGTSSFSSLRHCFRGPLHRHLLVEERCDGIERGGGLARRVLDIQHLDRAAGLAVV